MKAASLEPPSAVTLPPEPLIERLSLWRFEKAPIGLRLLYEGSGLPEWLAFVPTNLQSSPLVDLLNRDPVHTVCVKATRGLVYIGLQHSA